MKIFAQGIDKLLDVISECASVLDGAEEIGSSDVSCVCWGVVAGMGLKRDEVSDEEFGLIRNGVRNAIAKLN